MTKEQFKKLKVGDSVAVYCDGKRDSTMGTEVLRIDRIFGKIDVLCKRPKLSYKYVLLKPTILPRCFVGTVKN